MADKKDNTKKKKKVIFTSPKGTLKWPKLTEPDYGNNEYPKPDGEYSTKLVMVESAPATQEFIELLQPLYDDAMDEAKEAFKKLKVATRKKLGSVTENPLFTVVYDEETEEPTGEIEFKFACTASGLRKKGPKKDTRWHRQVPLFDAKGKIMKPAPDVWGGTVAKVSFETRPYFIPGTGAAGLKLALEATQVIDLVQGGVRSADQYGFGEEEGYEYSEEDAPKPEEGNEEFSGEGTGGDTDDDDEGDF